MERLTKYFSLILLFLLSLSVPSQSQQCLIVRSAEGHRFRNSMIAGALTGGVGFAAGAAFGGAKYEYVDGMNFPSLHLKYNGGELQKLIAQGVHIIVINKKAQFDEVKSAHDSCKEFVEERRKLVASPAPLVAPAPVPDPVPAAVTPSSQPHLDTLPTTVTLDITTIKGSNSSEPQPNSVADAARRYREQKAQQHAEGNIR